MEQYHPLNVLLPQAHKDSCAPVHLLLQHNQSHYHNAAQWRYMLAAGHQHDHMDTQMYNRDILWAINIHYDQNICNMLLFTCGTRYRSISCMCSACCSHLPKDTVTTVYKNILRSSASNVIGVNKACSRTILRSIQTNSSYWKQGRNKV